MLNRILAVTTLLVIIISAGGLVYFYTDYQAADAQQQAEQKQLLDWVNAQQANAQGAFAQQGQGAKLLRWAPVSQGAKDGRFFREYHLDYILNAEHLCLALMVSYQSRQPVVDSAVWVPDPDDCL